MVRTLRSVDEIGKLVDLWVKLMDDREASDLRFVLDEDARRRWAEYMVGAYLEDPESILVAEDNGIPVGFIASRSYSFPFKLRGSDRYAVITDLYVLPECRGRGIGRKLLEECISRLKARGYTRVRLSVWVGNRRAIKLYGSVGFKPKMIVMEKDLV
ncbi:MAG: GNAT family N-acetyltransferase, partial [Candidatus Bathyarchaeota archaeon]|nr:GNAT family N-acetyltransferase [Candidatus Bathyarchaeota archaeon]MCX8162626.1 GNAT family N-acetyltransferase [Candidatus Bathyarchaeota archaeon]